MARANRRRNSSSSSSRGEIPISRCLAVSQVHRAHLVAKGYPSPRITLGDEEYLRPSQLGTPSTPVGASYMRPFEMVVAAYKTGRQTAYKNRRVHDISPLQALTKIMAEFDPGAQELSIARLAARLVAMVEFKGLLKGCSTAVSAGACLLAADLAFRRGLLTEMGFEVMGVYGKAVISAYNVLKGQTYGDGEVVLAVLAAGGDTGVFPGKGSPARVMGKSALTVAREGIAARGGSKLRVVENAEPDPVTVPVVENSQIGYPLQRSKRYYSSLLDDGVLFELAEDSEDEDIGGGVALGGNCKNNVGLGIDFDNGCQTKRLRRNSVTELGAALGNLVI